MGHSGINFTLNTYTHVNFEDARSELRCVVGDYFITFAEENIRKYVTI